MSELEELRRRVETLEEEMSRLSEVERDVRRLRDESLTTRSFAGMIDREVAELRTVLRGHTNVLNALRETQVEQGAEIRGITTTLREMAGVVGGLVTGQTAAAQQMTAMREEQAAMREEQAAMREQLQRIADRLDADS